MKPEIWDFHCDVLSKMQMDESLDFLEDDRLDVNVARMGQGGVKAQCFAIFLSEKAGKPRFESILNQIDIFRQKVVPAGLVPLLSADDLDKVEGSGQLGALLSLEGADGLEANMHYLQLCYERGVRLLGLTWNFGNWAADGILEPRGGGLTPQGVELVKACHRLGIILDVSHLSVKGFWEMAELAEKAGIPFLASHSNAYSVCSHVRNLRDDQIEAILSLEGRIGLTFVPWFVKKAPQVNASDLLPHIDHICSLGGENILMLGSDFDGIDAHIEGLNHAGQLGEFANLLLKHYPEKLVNGWLSGNGRTFLKKWLPQNK
ncbi:membrane dipeptidase [Paenibacillus faecis]|uniref:Membrane dipeptidase n=1 Tax=Paenibacillus faecis TaxID=862114 RepID=A0A5D0CWF7_9BACL|nr:membrane dipeptidase [Paenibacillus faecis]TYA14276.1 membrane dipeptidase [Paenibacillus faecis]